MRRIFCTRLTLFVLGALLFGMLSSVSAQKIKHTRSGSVHATLTSVQVGIGWTWGKGTLTLLDGTEYHFKIRGLDVIAVGVKQATLVGTVYNLNKPEDFNGKYVKASAGLTVGGGAGASTLSNDRGVLINMTGTSAGINVELAISGMTVKLGAKVK